MDGDAGGRENEEEEDQDENICSRALTRAKMSLNRQRQRYMHAYQWIILEHASAPGIALGKMTLPLIHFQGGVERLNAFWNPTIRNLGGGAKNETTHCQTIVSEGDSTFNSQ